MDCPACREKLAPTTYEGVRVTRCKTCEGYWLGAKELEEIKKRRGKKFAQKDIVKMKVLKEWKVLEAEDPSTRKCPKCEVAMTRVHYDGIPGLVIEKCVRNCGMWLDHGELEKIQIAEETK